MEILLTALLILMAVPIALFLLYVLFLAVCCLFISPKKEYDRHSSFHRAILTTATDAALWLLGIRVHVTGREKLPPSGRILFVGNHVSNYDPIVTWHAFPKFTIAFISKPSNFGIPLFGRIIRKCCFMPIDREDPRKAIHTINRAAGLLKQEQVSIGVYPEGTRSKTGQLLPFHNGVFKIAQKARCPMAVIRLSGTQDIHKNVLRRISHVYLDVAQVIPPEELVGVKTELIGQRVRALLTDNKEKERNTDEQDICAL